MPTLKTKNNITWNYEMKGEGEPFLFLHGWGANRRIWKQQFDHFAKDYKTMIVDLPGHGKSSWEQVSLEALIDDIEEICSELHLQDINLFGNSLGGLIAMKLIEAYPERIKRFISVGALPKFVKSENYPFGLWAPRIYKLDSMLEEEYPIVLNVFFRSLFTIEERRECKIKWLQQFRQQDDVPQRKALREYLKIMENQDLRKTFSEISFPVLLINGTEDDIVSKDAVHYLQGILPHVKVRFFERCGHFPFLTKPDAFNRVVEDFLKTQ